MGCDEIFPQNDQFWPNPPKASQVQCEFMKEYQENLKAYMQASMAFMNKMSIPPPCPQAALENDHSVLIDGIPEPYMDGLPSARRAQDLQALITHFDKLSTEAYPIAFYRVGAFSPNRRRGIRVIFATQEHQNDVLTKSELANKMYPQSNRIMIKRAN
uniref:Uncharacterized protein n=1 Tax=Acrobeloides nanus TaxID=290746 RepID=A0A914EMX6_9BILA